MILLGDHVEVHDAPGYETFYGTVVGLGNRAQVAVIKCGQGAFCEDALHTVPLGTLTLVYREEKSDA